MNNVLKFIIKNNFILLFVVLEIFALSIFFSANNYQSTKVMRLHNRVAATFYKHVSSVESFFNLRNENKMLRAENAELYKKLKSSQYICDTSEYSITDTLYKQQYTYVPARVIYNSIDKHNNFIMLNKGKNDNIEKDMAVISPLGAVGIVVSVSDNFCLVMSLLNTSFRLSCKLLNSDEIGSVSWDGRHYKKGLLTDIPFHVEINVGDTVVTSGYSYSFPKGIMVGTVTDYSATDNSHFYTATINYSVNYGSIGSVYIINNLMIQELQKLDSIKNTLIN
ncbi:MAG: rod shape-determining protein MreC [Bacteroidales bacterium]|jgi:rod shape-determining protein MreC